MSMAQIPKREAAVVAAMLLWQGILTSAFGGWLNPPQISTGTVVSAATNQAGAYARSRDVAETNAVAGDTAAKLTAGTNALAGDTAAKLTAGTNAVAGDTATKLTAGTNAVAGDTATKLTAGTNALAGDTAAKLTAGTNALAGDTAAKLTAGTNALRADIEARGYAPTDSVAVISNILTATRNNPKYVTTEGSSELGSEQVLSSDDFLVANNAVRLQPRIEQSMVDTLWRVLRNEGASASAMPYGWSDEFEDQTGVDTANSTNENYTTDAGYYAGNGPHGNALQFDGSDDYALFPDCAQYQCMTGEMTYACWVFMPNPSACAQTVLMANGSVWGGGSLHFHFNGTIPGFAVVRDGIGEIMWTTTVSPTSVWTHVIYIMSFTGSKIYVNGVDKTSYASDYSGIDSQANGISLGAFTDGLRGTPLVGKIDEVQVFNWALSPADCTNIYGGVTGIKGDTGVSPWSNTNLYLLAHLDENTGTNMTDDSVWGNDGYTINGPTWVASAVALTPDSLTNMILVSQPFPSTYPFQSMRLSAKVYDVGGTGIIGTNTPGRVSANNGTNYYVVPWTETNSLGGNYWMLSGMAAVTSTPTTVSNRWRLDMTNNVEYQYHAVDVRGNW